VTWWDYWTPPPIDPACARGDGRLAAVHRVIAGRRVSLCLACHAELVRLERTGAERTRPGPAPRMLPERSGA